MNRGKILVTGGRGYLGSVLVEALAQSGAEVVALDRVPWEDTHPPTRGVQQIEADITDPGDWQGVLAGVSAVVHLAAVVGDPACGVDPDRTWDTNYLGTIRVAEACRRQGVRRLLLASTCSTYGYTGDEEVDVWSPLRPQSLYAETKVLAEHYLLSPHDAGPTPCILRFATLYGLSPRMRFDLSVNIMTANAVADGRIVVYGGRQRRPILHVRDAAAAIERALATPSWPGPLVHNVGSQRDNHRISSIAQIIAQEVPGTMIDVQEEVVDTRDYRVSFGAYARAFRFAPARGLVDGVRQIRDAIRAGHYADFRAARYSNYLTAMQAVQPNPAS
ncbi:SDR family oxidoreductase [Micromonospora sp. CPCC 205539]|uniref:NAD-dependent epimerase/dehydratase family protein n=1 Tax=Micromonospora sp. CPCC 205539 TaxID=3122408 RepID=UPI002FEFEE21